ncbi:MAG: arginine--tRNA ligase [Chloroflexota bacterium]|nr:MAG: arginine--tRNA ligase [Chloroflexota bacterium]
MIRYQLIELIKNAIQAAQQAGDLPPFDLPEIVVERPKDPAHGDFATPVAMSLARLARMAPLQIAAKIISHLPAADYLGEVAAAPPGFINLRLAESWLAQQVETILAEGDGFGRVNLGQKNVQVEFISANPTGPLVVGSGRNAVLGDTLAKVLAATSHTVQREYYVNDVGTQVDNLGKAMFARYAQALGQAEPDPEEYQGEYLVEMGQAAAQQFGDKYLHLDRAEALAFMRRYALDGIIAGLKEDTALIGIHFDNWFSEQSLYDDGTYELALDKLKAKNMLVERDGALWLKSEDEDDKENVIVRSDGRPTYFASDIAYVWNKLGKRNFEWAIYIWGADHHGHVKRVKNAAKGLGLDTDKLTMILYQLVTLTRDGVPVRQSKRAGNFITVREVVEEIGADAFRFMLLTRSADSPMELDLTLATKQSNENPVFYVQYGHARIASIFRKAQEEGASMEGGDVSLLTHPSEMTLIREMLRLREIVAHAAENLAPHYLTYYAQDLATAFHAFYRDCRVVSEDAALTAARLKLVKAAQITLANTLRLMGMSAPERM